MRYLVVLLLVSGCATQAQTRQNVEAQTDQAFQECAGIFEPGSDAHFRCVQDRVKSAQPRRRTQETTTCRPDGIGGTRCVTR